MFIYASSRPRWSLLRTQVGCLWNYRIRSLVGGQIEYKDKYVSRLISLPAVFSALRHVCVGTAAGISVLMLY